MANSFPPATFMRMADGVPLKLPAKLGRFELKSLLGQGVKAQVWLALDPRLEREVAIKLMRPVQGSNASALDQWLQKARSVGSLRHANIVTVFEADVQDQQLCLVLEYVPGRTLAQLLMVQGAMSALQAAALMQEVLSALVAAHASGVIHRDLKPSNVLIDGAGRARVMDFYIPAQIVLEQAGAPGAAGTLAYMAPEALRGETFSPLMDVYSVGLMLAELVWGKPLRAGQNVQRSMQPAVPQALELPPELHSRLDDRLRPIVLRALALDPRQRHPNAQVFLDALREWSSKNQLAQGLAESAQAGHQNSTLEFLMRRMRGNSDFPALSESIGRIQRMASSEKESISSITNEILKDVALTNKLLRLVNSAHYAHSSSIGTVSRAVSLVGFNGIRNMAFSLVLLEHMHDKPNVQLLKEEFLGALMAGTIASELSSTTVEREDAFIGALFQNLGRMVSQFYFPAEVASIRKLMTTPPYPMSEASASARVLGLNFESLGLGVARAWDLPKSIQHCIIGPASDPPNQISNDVQNRLRWCSRAANEMADTMLRADAQEVDQRLAQSARRYARVLGLSAEQIKSATLAARKKLLELVDAMEITVRPDSLASYLLKDSHDATQAHLKYANEDDEVLAETELQATRMLPVGQPIAIKKEHAAQTLAAGIQDIVNVMVEDFKLSDVLRMILEAMFRAFDFHRIVFCMRDTKTDTLTGRFGLGAGIEGVVKMFCVPLNAQGTSDLFATICSKGTDTLISDASDPRIAQRLPAWYRRSYAAPTFLILPLLLKGRPFGLIYADKAEKGGLVLDEKELAMLRTLRNQAVMAFRQSS